MSRIPYSPAQVDFFEVIEELPVKAAEVFQQFAAEHNATPGLPVDKALRHPFPSSVGVGNEQVGNVRQCAQVKGRNPASPNCWERTRWMLKGTIGVENPATKRPGFGVTVRKGDPLLQSAIPDDGVRIQNEDVAPRAPGDSFVIALGESEVRSVFQYAGAWVELVDEFDRAVGRSVVGHDDLDRDAPPLPLETPETIADHLHIIPAQHNDGQCHNQLQSKDRSRSVSISAALPIASARGESQRCGAGVGSEDAQLAGNPALLVVPQPWVHGQRQYLTRCFLGHGEIAVLVTEVAVGLL